MKRKFGREARRLGLWSVGLAGAGLLLCGARPALAKVAVQGNVAWWDPDANAYQPLRRARVRIVLAEDYDYDTGDVETTTNDGGAYRITKGNAWWRSGYKAYAIVFAEVPGKLEVQSHYMQVDGYQAKTGKVFAKDDGTKVLDVRIGGPQQNVSFQVGGVAALNNSDGTDGTHGWRAFVLCNEMTEHRLGLMARGISNSNFEEKEVSFPYNDASVASYMRPWDYIRFPDSYFDTSLARVSKGARHEMSHGVMADMYWTWPGVFHGSAGSHSLDKVAERREFAWSEAWAEFLAQVTHRDAFASTYGDFETQDGTMPDGFKAWRPGVPANADRSYVEGEIVSALWDIHDGTGTEKRMDQVAEIPGEETFYDGISDPSLAKIWAIFADEHPHSFTHESFLGDPDSFVRYWVSKKKFGQPHELKTILYNRGIRVNELKQGAPSVKVGAVTFNAFTATIPITVTEPDAEDRPFVKAELFVNGVKTRTQKLDKGWAGDARSTVFEVPIAWKKGTPKPEILVAVDDEMQSAFVKRTLEPTSEATLGGVSVRLQGIAVNNYRSESPSTPWTLNLVRVSLGADAGGASKGALTVPAKLSEAWEIAPGGRRLFMPSDSEAEILRSEAVGDALTLQFQLMGMAVDKATKATRPLTAAKGSVSLGAAQNYGLGERVVKAKLDDPGIEVEVYFEVVPATQKTFTPFLLPLPTLTFIPGLVQPETPAEDPPGTPKPLPKTPGAMISRANSLLRQVARLQSNLVEVTNELQWKASAQGLGSGGRKESSARAPQVLEMDAPANAPIATLIRPGLLQPTGILALPQMPFLDTAAAGEGLLAELEPASRAGLDDLALTVGDIQTRLAQASADSAKLKVGLEAFAKEAATAPVLPGEKKFDGKLIADVAQRLALVPPAVQAASPILAKQKAIVMASLKRVRPGAVSGRFTGVALQPLKATPRFKFDRLQPIVAPESLDVRPDGPILRPRENGGGRPPVIRRPLPR